MGNIHTSIFKGKGGTSGTSGIENSQNVEKLYLTPSAFLSGMGSPSVDIGKCNDKYLDISTGNIWIKKYTSNQNNNQLYFKRIDELISDGANISNISDANINLFSSCGTSCELFLPYNNFEIILNEPTIIRPLSTSSTSYYCTSGVPKYNLPSTSSTSDRTHAWQFIEDVANSKENTGCDITNGGLTIVISSEGTGLVSINGGQTFREFTFPDMMYGRDCAISKDGKVVAFLMDTNSTNSTSGYVYINTDFDYETAESFYDENSTSWSRFPVGFNGDDLVSVDLSYHGNYIIVGGAGTSSWVSKTPFDTWNNINIGTDKAKKVISSQNSDDTNVYFIVAGEGGYVYKSINSGTSWSQINDISADKPASTMSFGVVSLGSDDYCENIVVSCDSKVWICQLDDYLSTNGTGNWSEYEPLGTNATLGGCNISKNGEIILVTDYNSDDSTLTENYGTNWERWDQNLIGSRYNAMLKFDKTNQKVAVVTQLNDGICLFSLPEQTTSELANIKREFYYATENIWEEVDDDINGTSLGLNSKKYSKIRYSSNISQNVVFNHEEYVIYGAGGNCYWEIVQTCTDIVNAAPNSCVELGAFSKTSQTGGINYYTETGTSMEEVVGINADNTALDKMTIYSCDEGCYYNINVNGAWHCSSSFNYPVTDFSQASTTYNLYAGFATKEINASNGTTEDWYIQNSECINPVTSGPYGKVTFDVNFTYTTTSGSIWIMPVISTINTGKITSDNIIPSDSATSYTGDFKLACNITKCNKADWVKIFSLDGSTSMIIDAVNVNRVPNGEFIYPDDKGATAGLPFNGYYQVDAYVMFSEEEKLLIPQTLDIDTYEVDSSFIDKYGDAGTGGDNLINISLQGSAIIYVYGDCLSRVFNVTTTLPNVPLTYEGGYCVVKYINNSIGSICTV